MKNKIIIVGKFLLCMVAFIADMFAMEGDWLYDVMPVETGRALVEKTIDPEVAVEYKSNWLENSSQYIAAYYPFHKQKASDVVLVHSKCEREESNTAAFGITLYSKDFHPYVIKFDKIVASGNVKESDIPYITARSIVEGIDPSDYKSSYVKFLEKIKEKCPTLFKEYPKPDSSNEVFTVIDFVRDSQLPNAEALIGDEDCGTDLNSFLHCEQAFIIDTLMNPASEFIEQFKLKLQQFPVDFTKVNSISFDIITYNDMCPVCFSTCHSFKDDILEKIREVVPLLPQDVRLSIVISSLRPYLISGELRTSLDGHMHSRGLNTKKMDTSFVTRYSTNKTIGTRHISEIPIPINFSTVQFINPFCENEQVKLSLRKCKIDIESLGRDFSKCQLEVCEKRTSEIAELLSYCRENGFIIDADIIGTMKRFLDSIAGPISNIQRSVNLGISGLNEYIEMHPSN